MALGARVRVRAAGAVVGQLDDAGAAMSGEGASPVEPFALRPPGQAFARHRSCSCPPSRRRVDGARGSPDTFFAGTGRPLHVRVMVRLPGVIPGRA